jgi:hypothetical protein
MLYYYAIIALHCIVLCRVNVYFFLFGWVLQEFLVQSYVGIQTGPN